jgi:S-layer protein (TIGR01567 family)
MVSNYIYVEKSLRIAIEICVLGILLFSGIASAAVVESVEIRGEVAQGPFLWNANNFPAFFYDFQGNIKTETLNVSYIDGRIIPRGQINYSTSPEEVSFTYSRFGKYQVIGFMAEKYFAGYTKNTTPPNPRPTTIFEGKSTISKGQLHKILIDDDTKRTIAVNRTIALKEGYVLKATDIDLNARLMNISLLKNGTEVDVSSLAADQTYVYSKNVSSVDLPLIMVRFENIFSGQELQVAFIKGLFQISDNPTIIVKEGDKFGKMNVTNVTNDGIKMNNSLGINLDKNTNVLLMGDIKFRVADSDSLRYYPFVEYAEPGTYEVRGLVFNEPTQGYMPVSWDARTFAGFYYDLKYDRSTETMGITETMEDIAASRTIEKERLWYNTTIARADFKVFEKEGVTVKTRTNYFIEGWMGEKWIAINDKSNKIAKLALEMGREDKKTLTTGETWSLGSGYEIKINAMDVRTNPRQVWFTLKKDGNIIDEAIVQAPAGSTIADKQNAVYFKTLTFQGESDALLFTIYVDTIFSGSTSNMIQFKYAWLIDSDSAMKIQAGDRYGDLEVRTANDLNIYLTNDPAINLTKGEEQPVFGDFKFRIADSDQLRFYLKKDFVIPDQSAAPIALSLQINNGDANANSTSVILNVSALNALEMSFSNDNINWGAWQSFSGIKIWKLSGGNGLKTVYFKTRNAAGESSTISDTILLEIPDPVFYNKVEIRGTVANEPDAPFMTPSWDARSFGAFYYNLKYDRSTENLAIVDTLISLNSTKTINKDGLWYNTTKSPVDFKVYEKEGVFVNGRNSYDIVGWQGKKQVAINGKVKKLANLVLEMGKEDKKTVLVGETWSLGSGYELKVNSIDASASPRQVWFTLSKNGNIIDEAIGQAPAGSSIWDKQKAVYFKTLTFQGESDALLFTLYVDTIFSGETSEMVQFKYGWLIDKDSSIEINVADRFGVFEVRTASDMFLQLSNEDPMNLTRNTETTIIGDIRFKIADSDSLRFYPAIIYTNPGTYELRGYPASADWDPSILASWNATNFPAFYYDLNNNRCSETLSLTQPLSIYSNNRMISKEELVYSSAKISVNFKAFEKEGVTVQGSPYFNILGWQGQKWVAINGKANKLARLVLEMDKDDKKTMAPGENWDIGAGHILTVDSVNARSSPRKVNFTLRKNGVVIAQGEGQSPENTSVEEKQKAVYNKTRTILGEPDSPLFAVYVDTIFDGATFDMVQFRYAWLIDMDSAMEIRTGDNFGVFEVTMVNNNQILLSNERPVGLSKNTEIPLIGDLKFRVADSDSLRFYPKVDKIIGGMEKPPYSLSVLINNGETNASSRYVTLSLSAIGASEMSFSNDGVSWSSWEPYSTAKSWTLTDGNGLKSVFFKARNAAGESSIVSDTIILASQEPVFYTKVDIRGRVVNEPDEPVMKPIWNASSFAGFFYDLKYDRSTETLEILQTMGNLKGLNARNIQKNELWYNTTTARADFKVYEKENVTVNSRSYYSIVGWQAQKWIGVKDNANKIAKLAFEMGKEDKKTLTTGENWSLGAGYELTINAIDARTTPRQVRFTLKKDGAIVDEGIGQAPTDSTISAKQKAVYYRTKTILGEPDALLFTVYVDTIFSGATSDMVQFKYAWLIDENSAKEIKASDQYGVFEVRTATSAFVNLSNENSVSLSRNSETTIMDYIKFRIADSDDLRFYPYVEFTEPGTYEIRGTVANMITDPYRPVSWDAQSFVGFYYDLKYDRSTESLTLAPTLSMLSVSRTIDREQLWYNTTIAKTDFKVYEKENVTVNSRSNYSPVGWQAENWIAINDKANKIAKLAYEMGKEEKKTLTTGQTWILGAGYDLTINAIDPLTNPRQVWFTLKKDGAIVDEGIGQAPINGTDAEQQKAVYYKTKTIMGESDALLFTVYVDTIFQGATSAMVQFKYAWLIDENSAKEIKAADKFGVFEVRMVNSTHILLSNENTISLSSNTETTLIGGIKFKVADNDTLRFYPKVDHIIPGILEPPYALSIVINDNNAYTVERSVILGVSAINAYEMSFSNDNLAWSPWEPYATSKPWNLSNGDELKTVYFKARNGDGEAGPVSDTIILNTSKPKISFETPYVNMSANSTRILNLTMDSAPAGLSGYNITVTLSKGSVAELISVDFPGWAFAVNNNSSLPSDSVWISALDINRKIENSSTNIILARLEIRGESSGFTDLVINAGRIDDDNGTIIEPEISTTRVNVLGVVPLPGFANSPTDPDKDELYEDIDGNGKKDLNDVIQFFNYIEWISENEPVYNFDFNGNGRIDFDDIIRLFEEL